MVSPSSVKRGETVRLCCFSFIYSLYLLSLSLSLSLSLYLSYLSYHFKPVEHFVSLSSHINSKNSTKPPPKNSLKTHKKKTPNSELRREKAWARLSLVPLLQAETDRDKVRRLASLESKGLIVNLKEEGVYHTEKYVSPRYVYLPESEKVDAQWWRGMRMFTRNIPYHER
jgi:hypothetical protein